MHLSSLVISPLLFVIGTAVGTFSSVVGGGALIMVPAVTTFAGLPLAGAIATLRLSAACSQTVTVAAFARRKDVSWVPALWISLLCIPGGYLGAKLVLHFNEKALGYAIASLMLVLLLITPKLSHAARCKPLLPPHWRIVTGISALVLGMYGGFYGAGFSTLIMFLLMLEGLPMLTASGSASVATVFMSFAASVPFLHAHLIDWQIFIPLTAGSAIGSWFGVGMAERYGLRWLRPLLAIVVISFALKLVFVH